MFEATLEMEGGVFTKEDTTTKLKDRHESFVRYRMGGKLT